jgi:HSP90 family molecular chaperone
VGMSREELIANLGTIAKSGSKEYIENLKETGQVMQENIIGQFGVGFYSSFIVADQVEVISRKSGENASAWISDGSGEF